MTCFTCTHRLSSAGNCHIGCGCIPDAEIRIGAGGKERIKIAEELVQKMLKENHKIVIRRVWPKSGLFPALYDGGTVFACANYKEGEITKTTNQFDRVIDSFKHGVPPILGEIKANAK